jgi:hypothetical protein
MKKTHFVLTVTSSLHTACGIGRKNNKWTVPVSRALRAITCVTCRASQTYHAVSTWEAEERQSGKVPMFCVVAYIGDCAMDNQPYWGELSDRLSDARAKADETWDWLVAEIKKDQHPLNDNIDKAAVVVWQVDSYHLRYGKPVDVVWGENNENIKYVRGHLDDELDSE